MDFPSRLPLSLDVSQPVDSDKLRQWNNEIEDFLAAPPSPQSSEETKEDCSVDQVSSLATIIHDEIVGAVSLKLGQEDEVDLVKLKEAYVSDAPQEILPQIDDAIRTGKNFLRWYIQLYLAKKGQIFPSAVEKLQVPELLGVLSAILEVHTVGKGAVGLNFARNVSLFLFYATYISFPGDESTAKALKYLAFDLKFTQLSLSILSRPCSAALALSIVRNVHNGIATLQGASRIAMQAEIDYEQTPVIVGENYPWTTTCRPKNNFQSICFDMLSWSMSSHPQFPGDLEDKRSDLVTEILGALYALRAGKLLGTEAGNEDLTNAVVSILGSDHKEDKRVLQCRLSAVSLLMDSDTKFGEDLLKNDGLDALLRLLESQVLDVITRTRVDNSATADLVPILVVLNKYAAGNSEVLSKVKCCIFPPEAEETFKKKAQEQLESVETKNMSPLDAPEGTLRGRLVKLLTWPEGHIKRCTGELFWTVCSSNPTEFVHRVGFGNALPLLSVKGFAKMPVSA